MTFRLDLSFVASCALIECVRVSDQPQCVFQRVSE